MINNKKGLSTVIVTVLLIGLTIVAVGIVWAVVSNTLNRGAETADWSTKCLGVDVSATSLACTDGATNKMCIVTLERTGTEDDALAGAKLVFKGYVTATPATLLSSSSAIEAGTGNIPLLVTKTTASLDSLIAKTGTVNKVEVTPYFKDTSNVEHLCSTTTFSL